MSGICFKLIQCREGGKVSGIQMKQDLPCVEITETRWWILVGAERGDIILLLLILCMFQNLYNKWQKKNDCLNLYFAWSPPHNSFRKLWDSYIVLMTSTSGTFSHIGVSLPSTSSHMWFCLFHQIIQKYTYTHIPFTRSNLNKVVFMKSYWPSAVFSHHILQSNIKLCIFLHSLGVVCGILT